jgi:hypothetical protein
LIHSDCNQMNEKCSKQLIQFPSIGYLMRWNYSHWHHPMLLSERTSSFEIRKALCWIFSKHMLYSIEALFEWTIFLIDCSLLNLSNLISNKYYVFYFFLFFNFKDHFKSQLKNKFQMQHVYFLQEYFSFFIEKNVDMFFVKYVYLMEDFENFE